MNGGGRRRVAWVIVGPALVGALSLAAGLTVGLPDDDVFIVVMLWLAPLFAFLAAVIATRVPGNAIAWLLLVVGLTVPVAVLASLAVPQEAPSGPSLVLGLASLVVDGSWMGFIFPILLVLFLFPTGSFLTPRWRWAGWLVGAMVMTFVVIYVLLTHWTSTIRGWTLENPYGVIPPSVWEGQIALLWTAGLVALALGGLISIVLRYRRSALVARAQIKWFVVPAVVFAAFYAASAAVPSDAFSSTSFFNVGFAVTFLSLPVAMTIAITRYRLYEIDRIFSRTVTYAVVLGVLGAGYSGLVLGLRSILPGIEGPLPVAISTLAMAAAFRPLAGRVQSFVDRRFFRRRYDAAAVAARVADELRESLSLAEVTGRVESVVDEILAPVTVGVWVAEEGP